MRVAVGITVKEEWVLERKKKKGEGRKSDNRSSEQREGKEREGMCEHQTAHSILGPMTTSLWCVPGCVVQSTVVCCPSPPVATIHSHTQHPPFCLMFVHLRHICIVQRTPRYTQRLPAPLAMCVFHVACSSRCYCTGVSLSFLLHDHISPLSTCQYPTPSCRPGSILLFW